MVGKRKAFISAGILMVSAGIIIALVSISSSANERPTIKPIEQVSKRGPKQQVEAAQPAIEISPMLSLAITIDSYRVINAGGSYNVSLQVSIHNTLDSPLTVTITGFGIKDWNGTKGVFHEGSAGKLITLEAYYLAKPKSKLSFITFSPVCDIPISFKNGWAFFSITTKDYGVLEGTAVVTVNDN